MSRELSVARALMIVVVALAAGVGVAYAPVPTLAAVTLVFLVGVRLYSTDGRILLPGSSPEHAADSGIVGHRGSPRDLIGKLTSGYLLLWWLAVVLVIGRVWSGASFEDSSSGPQALQAAAGGDLINQFLVVCYGAVGMLFLVAAMKRSSAALRWILVLWLIYLCWGYVSLLWSIYPFLTVRRLVAFAVVSLGSIGFGAGFYGSQPNGRHLFVRHTILAGILAALALLIPAALRGDLANLLDPSYILRFASNTYSYVAFPAVVSLLMIVTTPMLGLRRWHRSYFLWVLVLLFAVFVLKVRGPLLFGALALGILYFLYRARASERLIQIGLVSSLFLGGYIIYSQGILSVLLPYLTRDAALQTTYSLTGRFPLWETLWFDVKLSPLLGMGFGAYWNPDNLARIWQTVGFPAVVAHNGYIEELLATGVVGLTLFLIFLVYAAYLAVNTIRRGDSFGWLTLLFLLLYLLLNLTQSLMQAYLEVPFIVLFAAIGLMVSKPPAIHHLVGRPKGSGTMQRERAYRYFVDPVEGPDRDSGEPDS